MGAIEPQLEAIRARLSQLLSTHLSQLNTVTCAHASGEIVIEQGAAAERLFLVSSGVLAVEVVEAGKPARVLALVRTGEILGEMYPQGRLAMNGNAQSWAESIQLLLDPQSPIPLPNTYPLETALNQELDCYQQWVSTREIS